MFKASLAFHIIGIVMWFAGLLVVTGLMRFLAKPEVEAPVQLAAKLTKRYTFALIVPGFFITLLSGLTQFFYNGAAYYMHQGWFHTKLTLLVVLIVITAFLWFEVKRVGEEGSLRGQLMGKVHGVVGLLLIAIVFLTMLGRV